MLMISQPPRQASPPDSARPDPRHAKWTPPAEVSQEANVANVVSKVALGSADAVAESYWHLHRQPESAWTLELDLRPWNERF